MAGLPLAVLRRLHSHRPHPQRRATPLRASPTAGGGTWRGIWPTRNSRPPGMQSLPARRTGPGLVRGEDQDHPRRRWIRLPSRSLAADIAILLRWTGATSAPRSGLAWRWARSFGWGGSGVTSVTCGRALALSPAAPFASPAASYSGRWARLTTVTTYPAPALGYRTVNAIACARKWSLGCSLLSPIGSSQLNFPPPSPADVYSPLKEKGPARVNLP